MSKSSAASAATLATALHLDAAVASGTYATFEQADGVSLTLLEALMAHGLQDARSARPYAMIYASIRYGVTLKEGQRGLTFDEKAKAYETARKAVQRALAACFPAADRPAKEAKPASDRKNGATPADKLLAAYLKLDAAQKRSFKAKLAAL